VDFFQRSVTDFLRQIVEALQHVVELLLDALERRRVDFIFRGYEIKNRLERLGLAGKSERFVQGFKARFCRARHVERELHHAGFLMAGHIFLPQLSTTARAVPLKNASRKASLPERA